MTATVLEDSILKTISKLLDIQTDEDYFDPNLAVLINDALNRLCQLGVGPSAPFRIVTGLETWNDFMPDISIFESVKEFIHLRVKLMFDPPSSGFVTNSIEARLKELEWTLCAFAENNKIDIFHPGIIYNVGDTVIKDGVHYVRITPQEVPEKWNFRNWKVYDYTDDTVKPYSTTQNYKVGDTCTYNSKYYVCVVNSAAGEFDTNKWVEYKP